MRWPSWEPRIIYKTCYWREIILLFALAGHIYKSYGLISRGNILICYAAMCFLVICSNLCRRREDVIYPIGKIIMEGPFSPYIKSVKLGSNKMVKQERLVTERF
jgi:hypothetical protein